MRCFAAPLEKKEQQAYYVLAGRTFSFSIFLSPGRSNRRDGARIEASMGMRLAHSPCFSMRAYLGQAFLLFNSLIPFGTTPPSSDYELAHGPNATPAVGQLVWFMHIRKPQYSRNLCQGRDFSEPAAAAAASLRAAGKGRAACTLPNWVACMEKPHRNLSQASAFPLLGLIQGLLP